MADGKVRSAACVEVLARKIRHCCLNGWFIILDDCLHRRLGIVSSVIRMGIS